MGGDAIGGFRDEDVNLDVFGYFGRYQVSVVFARVIACEHNLETGNVDEKHCRSQHMASWIGGNVDGRDGMGCVVVYCFNCWEGR